MFIERPLSDAIKTGAPRRPILGVGINDAPYITWCKGSDGKMLQCLYYRKWSDMLKRVYCPKHKARQPTYVGCTLEPAWHSFMAFRAWMETQEWQGKELDKDLLDPGNKHYGPDTCLFVSCTLNHLLCLKARARGYYPLGVSVDTRGSTPRFQAKCSFYGKEAYLGSFDTQEEAAEAYKQAKLAYIAELASKETNPRIKQALLRLY